jgi:hypothetical protein
MVGGSVVLVVVLLLFTKDKDIREAARNANVQRRGTVEGRLFDRRSKIDCTVSTIFRLGESRSALRTIQHVWSYGQSNRALQTCHPVWYVL